MVTRPPDRIGPPGRLQTRAPRPELRDWLVVVLLMAAMLASLLDRFALSLLIEPVKKDMALTDAQIGLLNGIGFGLFYAVMGRPLGWLADRWSRRGTILLGMTTWSAATAGCGLATGFGQLLAARMAVGAGEAGLQPASYGIIRDRFPEHLLSRAVSLLQVGAMVGIGAAMAISGAIFNLFQNGVGDHLPLVGGLSAWQRTFVCISVPPLLLLPFIARLRARGPVATNAGRVSLTAALSSAPSVFGLVFLTMAMVMTATYALLTWVPAILGREAGMTPGAIGATFGPAMMATGTAGLLGGGWLADHLVRRNVDHAHWIVMLIATVLAMPAALALPNVSGSGAIIAVSASAQAALAMPIGVAPAYLQLRSPPGARAQVAAAYHLVLNVVGFGAGTTLIGYLASDTAVGATALRMAVSHVIVGALVLATLSVSILLLRIRPRSGGGEPAV